MQSHHFNCSYPPNPYDESKKVMRADYLQTQLLVFQPGTTPQSLPLDLESTMAAFVDTQHCPRLIREQYLKSFNQRNSDEEEVEDPLLPDPEPINPADIQQDPYMSGLGAQLTNNDINNLNCIDDAEERVDDEDEVPNMYANLVTDETEDWSKDRLALGLTATQIVDAGKWIEVTKANTESMHVEWEESFNPDFLNEHQRPVFDLFEECVMGNEPVPEARLIDLSGGAGSGKSTLVKTILFQSEQRCGDRRRIRVCAFTNQAMKDFIGGVTIHHLFKLKVNRGTKANYKTQEELSGEALACLQEDFRTTRAVIIDEKSMIGSFMFWCIDQRLRQARPSHAHLPFGGIVMMLCGDLSQLPPVGDKALYVTSGKMTDKQQLGRALYSLFTECYALDNSMRQMGEENAIFRDELNRLGRGKFNVDDWQRWRTRDLVNLPAEERERFLTQGMKLASRKVDMVTFNEAGLLRTGNPVLVMHATHNNVTASKATEKQAQLPRILPVTRGADVVLTDNLWKEEGLINGSQGKISHIVFEEDNGPSDGLPAFLVVNFPDYTGPPYIPGEPGTVPIHSRLADWYQGKTRCMRRMFPLILAYSLTIHKSQGELSTSLYQPKLFGSQSDLNTPILMSCNISNLFFFIQSIFLFVYYFKRKYF